VFALAQASHPSHRSGVPLKPERPLVVAVFGKDGSRRVEKESTRLEQSDLEAMIAEKFAHSLSMRGVAAETGRRAREEPGDAWLQVGGQDVLVQITECVDRVDDELTRLRCRLEAQLRGRRPEFVPFAGCRLTFILSCDYADTTFRQMSFAGVETGIADWALTLLSDPSGVELRKRKIIDWCSAPKNLQVKLEIARYETNAVSEYQTCVTGGLARNPVNWLANTIENKRRPVSVPHRPFWLLVYRTDPWFDLSRDEAATMERLCRYGCDPFDDIWLFSPQVGAGKGSVVSIMDFGPSSEFLPSLRSDKTLGILLPRNRARVTTTRWTVSV